MVENVSSEKLDEIISDNKIVFVDCFAEWCAPCRALGPILAELDEKYNQRGLKVVKIDVDQNQTFSVENQISGVPAVLVFQDGKRVIFDDGRGQKMDKLIGVMPPEIYDQIVNQLLAEA